MSDIIEDTPTTGHKFAAETLGTFVLVFFGCGAAMRSGGDYVATALAFGLTVVVMAYAVGRISGGHFNPAVTLGAALGGRLPWSTVGIYMAAQLLGGLLAGAVLFGLNHGFAGFSSEGNMAQNSFGDSGTGYAWWAAFLLEALMTMVFLWVILAVTDTRNEVNVAMGPLAIGLALAMIHFASISATGTSVNPARSIGVGVFAGTDAIIQLWLFVLAPLLGAAIAGLTYPVIFGQGAEPVAGSGLNFGGGNKHHYVPGNYDAQWNQGQQAGWGQPGAAWGAPPQQGYPQGAPQGPARSSGAPRRPSSPTRPTVLRSPRPASGASPTRPSRVVNSPRSRLPSKVVRGAPRRPADSPASPATGATPRATTTAAPRSAAPTDSAPLVADEHGPPARVDLVDADEADPRPVGPERRWCRPLRASAPGQAPAPRPGRSPPAGPGRRRTCQPSPRRGSAGIASPASAPSCPARHVALARVLPHPPHVAVVVLGVVAGRRLVRSVDPSGGAHRCRARGRRSP